MTETEYKRKLKQLKWLKDKASGLNTKVYDEEIYWLSNEIRQYEERETTIEEPDTIETILYHIERTGIKKCILADKIGISRPYFSKIITNETVLSENMEQKILNFDFNLL